MKNIVPSLVDYMIYDASSQVPDTSLQKTRCVCDCEDWSTRGQCDCKCKERRTECAPGYAKICPEKDGKCGGDTKSPLCPKDIFAMMEPAGRALDNWIQVREGDERSFDLGDPLTAPLAQTRVIFCELAPIN